MWSSLHFSSLHLSSSQALTAELIGYQQLFVAGNWAMLLGLLMTLLSVVFSYTLAEQFSLLLQGLFHISTLLWATLIKFGFIMRFVAENKRNQWLRQQA